MAEETATAPDVAPDVAEEAKAEPAAAAVATTDEQPDPAAAAADADEAKADDAGEEKTEESPKEEEAKPAAPTGRGSGRVRKSTAVYVPVVQEKKEKVIPDGNGEKLGDMPRVVAKFKAVTWSDPSLHSLYSVIFGVGKKKEYKPHLLQFNGIVYPEGEDKVEKEKERLQAKMFKLKMDELKAVMDLADIERSAESFDGKAPGKEALCNRFLEWLEEPKASGKKVTAASTKKRKSAGSAKKAAPKKAKKGMAKKSPAKETAAKKKPAAKKVTPKEAESEVPELDIPGVDTEKVKAKVKSIVENANREELTVKGVRKMLEDWLDTDLSEHKDAVRAIVMEVM